MGAQLGELCLEAGMAGDVDGHDGERERISRAMVYRVRRSGWRNGGEL